MDVFLYVTGILYCEIFFCATNILNVNPIFAIYARNTKCNENEAVNYFEKSFSKVMFDSTGNHNERVDGIINGHTKDGTNGTTNARRKVYLYYPIRRNFTSILRVPLYVSITLFL